MRVEDLFSALDYIEEHIKGEIFIQDIADHCYSSLSGLQKTFKYVFRVSINDYILKRRFSCAANDLLKTDHTILEIALNYGYSNAESFTRGFQKVWKMSPSEFRKTRKFACHTPKFSLQNMTTSKGELAMNGTKYDLTDLYEVLNNKKNNAYVCADITGLKWINDNLGIEAGDAALMELRKRVENACSEDDLFFRTGGDEFVVFTNSEDMTHAEEIVAKVSAQNGEKITCGEHEFAVSIHIGAFKKNSTRNMNAKEIFTTISDNMVEIHND